MHLKPYNQSHDTQQICRCQKKISLLCCARFMIRFMILPLGRWHILTFKPFVHNNPIGYLLTILVFIDWIYEPLCPVRKSALYSCKTKTDTCELPTYPPIALQLIFEIFSARNWFFILVFVYFELATQVVLENQVWNRQKINFKNQFREQ